MPKAKARVLLESYLDEKQLHDFRKYGHFFVITDDRRVYQLKDGASIVSWTQAGPRTAFGVWAYRDDGEMHDECTSLLTQLLFLTSDPDEILEVACTEGGFFNDGRGAPPMKGRFADPEGKVPLHAPYDE